MSAADEERRRALARLHELRLQSFALEQKMIDVVSDAVDAGLTKLEIANELELGQAQAEALYRAAVARGTTIDAGS